MYGKTVNSQTFMERSANHSTKGSRRGFVDVETGINAADVLTPAQKRDNLKRRHEALCEQRKKVKQLYSGKEEYKRLGLEIQDVQNQMNALNLEHSSMARSSVGFDYLFVQCAKSMLTTSEYARIADAARRMALESA